LKEFGINADGEKFISDILRRTCDVV